MRRPEHPWIVLAVSAPREEEPRHLAEEPG